MKIKVEKEKCIGCGACVSIAQTVFDFDDDNMAKVIVNKVSEDDEQNVIEALENCPTGAIIKEETQE
jgi:ferredoxin